MAVTITRTGDNFTMSGKTYFPVYNALALGLNDVGIYAKHDTRLQILGATHYSEFTVNGSTFLSQTALISALQGVISASNYLGINDKAADSELLDGKDSNEFMIHEQDTLSNFDTVSVSGHYRTASGATGTPPSESGLGGSLIHYNYDGNTARQMFLAFSSGQTYYRYKVSASWGSWDKMWHGGNDGSGSGLDADLLDGNEGAYYLNTGGSNQTKTGNFDGDFGLTIRNDSTGSSSAAALTLIGEGNNFYIRNYGDNTSKPNVTTFRSTAGGSSMEFILSGAPVFTLESGGNAVFANDVYANDFILNSDKRLKEDIEPYKDTIDIDFKTFRMKSDPQERKRVGVMAQEVEKVAPEFVHTNEDGFKSVSYIDLLCAKVSELEARIKELESSK